MTSAPDAQAFQATAAGLGQMAQQLLRSPQETGHAEQALHLVRRGLGMVVDDADPLRPKLRHVEAMAMRWSMTDGDRDVAAATDRQAWATSLVRAPGDAIAFAADWGDWAWTHEIWDEAAEAYQNAHQAMRRYILRDVGDNDERLKLLANTQYASRGAYALGMLQRIRDAAILLERAGDLVTTANANLADMQRLLRMDPALRARFDAAVQSRYGHRTGPTDGAGLDALGNLPPGVPDAQAAVDAVVSDIRRLPGLDRFMLGSNWTDIQMAVCAKPMVYLAPTDKGTACWVLAQNADGQIRGAIVPMAFDAEAIRAAAMPFIDAEFGEPRTDSRAPLDRLLRWLGDHVMVPVRDALAALGHAAGPIVLRPFGMLGYLPLQEATGDDTGAPVFAPGAVTMAYSARHCARAFALADEAPAGPWLVVDNPRPLPMEFEPLPLARFEAAAVAARRPATMLGGRDATVAKVLAALPDAGLVHFICHGTVDRRLNYSGVLLLANLEELTILHLRRIPALAARLVVLSSCRGGAAGIAVEHPVSLPAAFLAAGARAVIATFWHADEMATVLLMSRFYALWDGRDCATALGAAQSWLRTSTAEALRRAVDPAALASPAGAMLRNAPADSYPYAHRWYTAGFFVAGA